MAFKDYNSKSLLTGGFLVAVCFAIVTFLFMLAYRIVGQLPTNILAVLSVVYFAWQFFHFAKNPKAEDEYINNLARVYSYSWAKHFNAIMMLVNAAAMLALFILGWWFVLAVGAVTSAIVWKHFDRAEARYIASVVAN